MNAGDFDPWTPEMLDAWFKMDLKNATEERDVTRAALARGVLALTEPGEGREVRAGSGSSVTRCPCKCSHEGTCAWCVERPARVLDGVLVQRLRNRCNIAYEHRNADTRFWGRAWSRKKYLVTHAIHEIEGLV